MFNHKIYYLFIAIGLIALYRKFNKSNLTSDGKEKKYPPSPPTYLPLGIGYLIDLASNYNHIFPIYNRWIKETNNSKTISTFVFGNPAIMILEPDCVQHVLAKNWTNYEKGPRFIDSFNDLLGNGIFNSNGDEWKFHRSAARPHFQRYIFIFIY